MSQTAQHTNETKDKHRSHAYAKVWLFFMYYWIIFGIGCYFGQFLPMEWRRPLSLALMVLVLITLVFQRARKYGLVISYICNYIGTFIICYVYKLFAKFRT